MVDSSEDDYCLDLQTPYGLQLSAFYKRSFAYYTTKKRWAAIVLNLIGHIEKDETIRIEYGPDTQDDVTAAIAKLHQLIADIAQNRELGRIHTDAPDTAQWNRALDFQTAIDGHSCYLNTAWIVSECYLYRRIQEIFEESSKLQKYDPFRGQKIQSFTGSISAISALGKYTIHSVEDSLPTEDIKQAFIKLLKLNLWSNKCDLSLTLGVTAQQVKEPLELLDELEPNILVDHTEEAWQIIQSNKGPNIVAIVHDNAGYELFSDLCLADYLIEHQLATTICFYVKAIPWFVSDVTAYDFTRILNAMKTSNSDDLKLLEKRWTNLLDTRQWVVMCPEYFWTLPNGFCEMHSVDPKLYRQLQDPKLIFFKGDLNYRKLMNDINWMPTTAFRKALQGFEPTNICTLRTIKADVVSGLPKGVTERLNELNPGWMLTGDYALIQVLWLTQ